MMKTIMRASQSSLASYKPSRTFIVVVFGLFALSFFSLFNGQLPHSQITDLALKITNGSLFEPIQSTVIWQWRAPRIFSAIIIGAALGVSGAIFQSLVKNPLGSPDVTGFNVGAFTGVLLTMAFIGTQFWFIVSGAIGGGLFAALLVYLFAYRNGMSGFRLIIVGIAISAMLTAFNMWLSLYVSLETAMTAALWSIGSLNGITWEKALPISLFLGFLLIVSAFLVTRMKLLEMGDDLAAALGVSVNKTRLLLLLLGVCLTAAPTAITGPIAFISLAAPQIAKRLNLSSKNTNESSLFAAALMGALLLLSADCLAQYALPSTKLPVGLVTISVGGLYLVYLISNESKN
ncbi:iron chelate uptake ABC transporter family permease subunit [Marinomonas mediterranea]|uniref:iron chelate uptake ABC transporter family permease subunit n=1 Tax=Marinomonas mediterranea TaxID=119864 RepID=UPI00234A5A63|nr:iron chelate uptake ABC transporter family permease subunit [Marinomonas mediterranea]WCN14068.1 iron chelate uptake ABC transporter family permease subunit [Marinomonas mediterranea]